MTIYLDSNATTPIEPAVAELVMHYMTVEYGNAGSRTHEFGLAAKKAVELAREQVAAVVNAKKDEVYFTSGATESNNIATLGLMSHGEETGKKHIISSAIEHKAILEPLECMTQKGFDVTLVGVDSGGRVDPEEIRSALRDDTLLVSIMHVNNETGVIQSLDEIARVLGDHAAYFHTDAAQGFGKDVNLLQNDRIDLTSISGHKIYGPMGVGALVARRRRFKRPPLSPIMYGGGQEKDLRPGTVPVPLVAGLGLAAELAIQNFAGRQAVNKSIRQNFLAVLKTLGPALNGVQEYTQTNTLNLSFPKVDSEAVMLALKGIVAISNGSACTSSSYEPSHVLTAMGLSSDRISSAVRLSWSHLTPSINVEEMVVALQKLI